MKRFEDVRTKDVYETGAHETIPQHVCQSACWKIHLLLAAHDLHDVGVIGRIARWDGIPRLFGLYVHGKWHVTFRWHEGFGAAEVKLERR